MSRPVLEDDVVAAVRFRKVLSHRDPREYVGFLIGRLRKPVRYETGLSVHEDGLPRPYLLVGWLWFLGMLVPVIGLVQVGSQSMADRYTYLPHIGLFIMIAWPVAEWAALLRAAPRRSSARKLPRRGRAPLP